MTFVIGVDGGGTSTRAVLMSADGRTVKRATGGAGWIDPTAPAAAAESISILCHELLRDARVEPPVATLCCGLAGAGSATQRDAVRVSLMLAGIAERVHVTGDAEAAMFDAFGNDAGVLVIAGTGSIAWAQGADGVNVRAGGWGHLLGDRGSGYAIGMDALRAIALSADGMAPPTRLVGDVLARLGVDSPRSLPAWAASATKAQVAALSPVVLAAAEDGDAAAANIIFAAVDAIVALAQAAARGAGLSAGREVAAGLALHGGLIGVEGPLREPVRRRLAEVLPQLRLIPRDADAACGAARMALSPPLSEAVPHP